MNEVKDKYDDDWCRYRSDVDYYKAKRWMYSFLDHDYSFIDRLEAYGLAKRSDWGIPRQKDARIAGQTTRKEKRVYS